MNFNQSSKSNFIKDHTKGFETFTKWNSIVKLYNAIASTIIFDFNDLISRCTRSLEHDDVVKNLEQSTSHLVDAFRM
jgi:hypothetical protein